MKKGFEAWPRFLCSGAFALTAWMLWVSTYRGFSIDPAQRLYVIATLLLMAVIFAIWPERLAYSYVGGRGVPRWSKALSVTRLDDEQATAYEDVQAALPRDRPTGFAAYEPRLKDLEAAFSSFVGYAIFYLGFPRDWDAAWIWAALIIPALILWVATIERSTPKI